MTTTSAVVTWTLESRKIGTILVLLTIFASLAAGFHTDGLSAFNSPENYYDSLQDPQTALTNFVAPFLLIAIILQRGFEKALMFSYADDDPFPTSGRSAEKKRVRKYSMIMSLATTGMIVPSPYFQLFQNYIAVLFGTISYLFFFAIVAAFLWVLWIAFT